MDKIYFKNIELLGYHGVLYSEKTEGQKFFLDLEMWYDSNQAIENDSIEMALDYGKVYETVKDEFTRQSYNLIETVANAIAHKILDSYEIVQTISVCVKKPNAPIKGIFEDVGVLIKRSR